MGNIALAEPSTGAPYQVMPPLSADEYAALKADIAANGVEVAVEVDEAGVLIDGHHRVRAWDELRGSGVMVPDYPRVRVSGLTHEQKRERARNLNLKRRHLTGDQKRDIAVELRLEGKTQTQIGEALGADQTTVSRWLKDLNMQTHIENGRGQKRPPSYKPRKVFLQDGTDDAQVRAGVEATYKATLKDLKGRASDPVIVKHTAQVIADTLASGGVETPDGEVQPVTALLPGLAVESINEAKERGKQRLAEERKEKQEAREERLAQETREAAARAVVSRQDALEFLRGLEPTSADLLLTDPPYMTDVRDVAAFAASWVPLALSRVASTGRAYICTGAYPLELQAYLNVLGAQSDFALANVLVWTYRNTLGPSPAKRYKSNWQAVFYLVGPDAPPLECPVMVEQFSVQDINAPDGRQGDRYHAWQKPYELARRFIEHSTRPGQLVIDPYAGTGTFVGMAARLGRRGLGSETDPAMLRLCEERGVEVRRAL